MSISLFAYGFMFSEQISELNLSTHAVEVGPNLIFHLF